MSLMICRSKCALVVVLVLMLSSCISPQQYRNDYNLCVSAQPERDCQFNSLQRYDDPASADSEYQLGFIEFDDQGQLWDRKQMRAVLDQLALDSVQQDLLMLVFVHGWKHSAKAGDDNIRSFRKTLRRLSAMESALSRQNGTEPRKIAGVYLGWRGGSVRAPLIKELTFWDRKEVAHKVGYGGVTEVLSRLELLQKTKRAMALADGEQSNTRLVVVGHSFGGAVVYSAVSELLERGFVQTQGPEGSVSDTIGIADLVVLINPAFEALRYGSLSDMSTERAFYSHGQLPVLAVLTSEADLATRYAFPAGRWLSTLFEVERDQLRHNGLTSADEMIDEGRANVTALGHFADYRTHYLKATAKPTDPLPMDFNLSDEVGLFLTVGNSWENDHPGNDIYFDGSLLERSESSAGRNPYLNILVDKKLIPNHNDINDPRIEKFIRQLILISSQNPDPQKRQQMRSKIMATHAR